MEQLWDFTTFQVMLLRNGKKKKQKPKKNTKKIPLALPIRNVLEGPVYTELSTYQPHEH